MFSAEICTANGLIFTFPKELYLRWYLLLIYFDFIINSIIFSIGAKIFTKKEMKSPPPAILMLILTFLGLVTAFIGLYFISRVTYEIWIVVSIVTILISGLDYIVIRKYLKLDKGKSLKLGIWMGIIANPLLVAIVAYVIFVFFLRR